ncbi:hypothetical protein TNCT_426261 [Trichonephila clavata]|uniref:Ankyrin repeat protein n=1 Tax=Trichonephila clavata TaxID=2740835 RepID=A0A8X6L8M2_TRICU|nr:hypothetical protein TNCT_426261 [Trichonephila clavata]
MQQQQDAQRDNRRARNQAHEMEFLPLRHIDPHIHFETIAYHNCLFRRSESGCEMFLLNHDLDRINAFIRSHENPSTPIHVAVIDYSNVNEVALDILIEENTSNLGMSYKRKTALHHAAHSCHPDLIAKLIKYRANPNKCDDDKKTPLHCILDCCDMRVLGTLSEKYKVNEFNSNGQEVYEVYNDPDPNVMELVDDLYKRGIAIADIILSAKLLIKYTLIRNVSLCKNWYKTQRRTIFPEILQYLQSGISEISSMKAKKIKSNESLYTLIVNRTKDRNIHCSPLSTQVIIKHVMKMPKNKSYHVFRSSIAKSLDQITLKNKLLECAIYGRSKCGRKKVSLNVDSVSCLCKYLRSVDILNLAIALSVLKENKRIFS